MLGALQTPTKQRITKSTVIQRFTNCVWEKQRICMTGRGKHVGLALLGTQQIKRRISVTIATLASLSTALRLRTYSKANHSNDSCLSTCLPFICFRYHGDGKAQQAAYTMECLILQARRSKQQDKSRFLKLAIEPYSRCSTPDCDDASSSAVTMRRFWCSAFYARKP